MTIRSLAGVLLVLAAETASAQIDKGIGRASWLRGCWEATTATGSVEENWMEPKGGSMIGVSRTIRDGKMTSYETIVLREEGDRLAYEAHPSGQSATTFLSTRITASELVFENPSHDFPQQVGYRRDGSAAHGTANRGGVSVPARTLRRRLAVRLRRLSGSVRDLFWRFAPGTAVPAAVRRPSSRATRARIRRSAGKLGSSRTAGTIHDPEARKPAVSKTS